LTVGQITSETIKLIRNALARGEAPPLTAWEYEQLCHAWETRQSALQPPGAQAVAWHTDDHLTDKSATTYDPVIADRWRAKGWPVTPHYTHPQPPSIPEPSEDDVDAAYGAFCAAWTKTKREQVADILTTYTARLRERIGQAPGDDGDA
jgi:hypothetical protein